MKTKLTLNTGSFYFLSTVNLIRGVAAEVELKDLTVAELKGLKSYVKSGTISSSENLFEYEIPSEEDLDATKIEPVVENPEPQEPEAGYVAPEDNITAVAPEDREEVLEEHSVGSRDTVEETVEEKIDYEKHTVKELKAMIKKRDLDTDATSKKDLVEFLESVDSK